MSRPTLMLAALAWLVVCPGPARAQSVDEGMLLTASADIESHAFARSVVLVVHHDSNGSIGLIVNRPTRLPAIGTFPGAEALGDYAGRVFVGGPVAPTSLLMLMRDPSGRLGETEPLLGDVHVLGEPGLVGELPGEPADESSLRLYAGRVQWQPEQLEREVSNGRWRVLAGSVEAVFSEEPLDLYRELSARAAELTVSAQRDR